MIDPGAFLAAVEALRTTPGVPLAELAPIRDGLLALAPANPDAMRIESRAVSVIEDGRYVERARWTWTCPCHLHTSGPWLDRPTDANAWAEHAVLFGGAK